MVCTPLAIDPPNGPVADSIGSVWIDCGSWSRVEATIFVSLRLAYPNLVGGSGHVDLKPSVPAGAAMATSQSSTVTAGPSPLRRWRGARRPTSVKLSRGSYFVSNSFDRPVPAVLPSR